MAINGLRFVVEVPLPESGGDIAALGDVIRSVEGRIRKTCLIHGIGQFNFNYTPFSPWVWEGVY